MLSSEPSFLAGFSESARAQWLLERRVLSHDEIKNNWFPAAVKHLRVVNGEVIDPQFVAEHVQKLRGELNPILDRCAAVAGGAQAALSPVVELLKPPLSRLPVGELERLGIVLHRDWLTRSDISARALALSRDIDIARSSCHAVLLAPGDIDPVRELSQALQAVGRQLSALLRAAPFPGTLV